MQKTIRVCVFVLLMAAAYTACQRASEEKRSEEMAPDSVTVVYNSLNDSIKVAWQDISATEEGKLSDMKRLLQEISYTPSYDKARYDSLWDNLQQVYALRFEAETMTSRQIDRYDSAVSKLQREVIDFARSHPSFEQYPLMGKLSDSIEAADQRTLFLRVRYDQFASEYNDFLKGNQGRMIQPSDTALPLRERPLFRLSE
ncbi:hypothetical protein [Cesiribacter sp. SM1]|uniref:hypothetical protein n=1 Tax=Cesiribacter sp. SM1 TaxID=2861196 RepID=UPI001CD53780|nr:hypothetical protein [Cesiribacter sp. SM1]